MPVRGGAGPKAAKPEHDYRVLYMSDPIYLNESDNIDVYLERKNNYTSAIEPATGLSTVTATYSATESGAAIHPSLTVALRERDAAPGFYYGVINGAAKGAHLTVGTQIFLRISDGGAHIDVTRPVVVRQVRDPINTANPGGDVTIIIPPPPPPPPPDDTDTTPAAVVIGPTNTRLLVGDTETIPVTVRNAAGANLAGVTPTSWSSSDSSIVSVDSGGVVTGVAEGTAAITAHYNAIDSNAIGITAYVITIILPPPPPPPDITPVSVVVSPTTLTLQSGAPQTVSAVIKNAEGAVLVLSPTSWTSSDSTKATVDASGVVTWVAQGSTRITAHYNALTSNSCTVTAVANVDTTPTSVVVSPSTMSLQNGVPQQLTAVIKNAANVALALSPTSWTSSDPTKATVSASGLVTWVAQGSTNVAAHYNTLDSNNCAVTAVVNVDTTPASVVIGQYFSQLLVGATETMTASVRNAAGTNLAGVNPTSWTSSAPSFVSVDSATGVATGVAAGAAQITAHYNALASTAASITAVAAVVGDHYPNQPAGFSILSPLLTGDVLPPSQSEYVAGSSNEIGWIRVNNVSVVTDPTSPEDSQKVFEIPYPAGAGNGGAPGEIFCYSSTNPQKWPQNPKEIYIRYQYKTAPNFPSSLGANKMMYGQIGNSDNGEVGNKLVYLINSSADYHFSGTADASSVVFDPNGGTNYNVPMWPTIIVQGTPSSDVVINQNVITGDPTLWKYQPRGVWCLHELYAKANTPGNSDGEIKVWFREQLIIHGTGIKWSNNPTQDKWWTMFWDPVYNNMIPLNASNAYHHMKNLYVSGKP